MSSVKRIVIIIAFRDFRDEEYFVPKGILEKEGFEVKTASNKSGVAMGAGGGEAQIDFLIPEIDPADFDAVVFVGGPGCLKNLNNEGSWRLCCQTIANAKILAAICISPVILAKAGVLNGVAATVWSGSLEKQGIEILKQCGALYLDEPVVSGRRIVTANGPAAAESFAKEIARLLTQK